MTDSTRRAEAPPDDPIPDDLEITNWICCDDPDLGLASVRTIGDLHSRFENWCYRVALGRHLYFLTFHAEDSRIYTGGAGLIVQPATPDEVRRAAGNAGTSLDALMFDAPVPDDLVIDDWIEYGESELALANARTVGDLRRRFDEWYGRLALPQHFRRLTFRAGDGHLYEAGFGLSFQPAALTEAWEAIENRKEYERERAVAALAERIGILDGYLDELDE